MTRLEFLMSFLQIKSTMGVHKKIREVKFEICRHRRETAQLEAIAGVDNPYA
jgi:hypothetical protein